MRVSVIIPTRDAERHIEALLSALEAQTLVPEEIIVVDSSSTDRTAQIAQRHGRVRFMTIPAASFDHGGTRDMAARQATGDALVFMTQDAVPADGAVLEALAGALEDGTVAAAYARQLPRPDAWPREKLVRAFNYPEQSTVHDRHSRLGLRTYYLSNACAAYRRETYLALGGFETKLRSNEDMLFAAKAIRAGYRIAYCAEARVIHSHNLTLAEQYRRNKLQGYELARHRELLGDDSPVGSGKQMLLYVTRGLLRQGRLPDCLAFGLDCVARFAGNRAGKREFEKGR